MGLSSQDLNDVEKRIFRKIVKAAAATPTGKRRLDRKLARITKGEVRINSAASKGITAEIRKQIIDPFRKKNPIK